MTHYSEVKGKRGWESLKSVKCDFSEKVNLTVLVAADMTNKGRPEKCPFDLVTC